MKSRNLRALEAFEAVSRHLSLTAAAAELGVTQSAISHQLRHLTEELGEKLLHRAGRKVDLTPAGNRLAVQLRTAFAQIDRSIDETLGTHRKTVRLAVCSCFAPGWLIRRLGDFYADRPGFSLQLRMYAQDPALTDEVADAFVTTFPSAQGYFALKLRNENLIAVRPRRSDTSQALPLVTTSFPPAEILGADWARYCRFAGLDFDLMHAGYWLEATHYVLALEMARQGLGVALVPDFLAEEALLSEQVQLECAMGMPTNEDYYLCIKSARRAEPALRELELWFRSQIPSSPLQEAATQLA
ncbi:LysR family transcriptional regulator (plasmid) [Aminobacter sp. Y103A]|uniref:LysR family transcriptional regulator n=1 Tax=Aminobacter sp. Y103A TaxID=1870862 RepID=UPI00257230AF|nr:LysR family transcriptional regulator [Aminobacter sp. SS-2016]BBD41040.1 LysR family transcriptional regulator [Aminobacter sp. SS-2016]